MSNFAQTTAQALNMGNATIAAMAMMPTAPEATNAQACQNQQQASQRQQPQNMRTQITSFTRAEDKPVFCFFYTYLGCSNSQKHLPTPFTKRSVKIVKRPEEILNHAHKGGARI